MPARADLDWSMRPIVPVGGINQQEDKADPFTELTEASNVYAPNGRVIQRPGAFGVAQHTKSGAAGVSIAANRISKSVSGVFTDYTGVASLGDVKIGDSWYVGFDVATIDGLSTDVEDLYTETIGLQFDANSTGNDSSALAQLQYWDGTYWRTIPYREYFNSGAAVPTEETRHLNRSGASGFTWLMFVFPRNWTTTSVNGATRYWFKMTMRNGGTTTNPTFGSISDSSALTEVDLGPGDTGLLTFISVTIHGMVQAQFNSGKKTAVLRTLNDSVTGAPKNIAYEIASSVDLQNSYVATQTRVRDVIQNEPASIVVVPETSSLYIAYDFSTARIQDVDNDSATVQPIALVEAQNLLIGRGSPYSKTTVVQLSEWPHSKYMLYHTNLLWAAHFENDKYGIRWSGVTPYERVWPAVNYERIAEADNSPITGMYSYNEHVVVWKQDSIYQMVLAGIDSLGLPRFIPRRVVAGIGCVSNSSVQQIRGSLIHLYEDGLYAFNGVTSQKITAKGRNSDRLRALWKRVTPGRRPWAVSTHWKEKNLYLLSMSVDGSPTNNLMLVWDYFNDTFWFWDDLGATQFLSEEDTYDRQQIFFSDAYGNVYQLRDAALDDHGGTITRRIRTHRQAHKANTTLEVCEIRLSGMNTVDTMSSMLLTDDNITGPTATTSFADGTEARNGEAEFGVDNWVLEKRRPGNSGYARTCRHFQWDISSSEPVPFNLSQIDTGLVVIGRRG